jgi:tRNA wybutosine-synthesizing protein 1
MDKSTLLGLPDELLLLWHSRRTEILVSVGVLVAIVRLAVHWRRSRRKAGLTPPLGNPIDEKLPLPSLYSSLEINEQSVKPQISKPRKAPKRVIGLKKAKSASATQENADKTLIQPFIFYFSLGGSTRSYAEEIRHSLQTKDPLMEVSPPILHDLAEIELDDYFLSVAKTRDANAAPFYLILVPSYDISTELDRYLLHLNETHNDFRVDTAPLSGLAGYCVFGFGDAQDWPEGKGFGKDATEVDKWMARLTAGKRAFPLGLGDVKSDAAIRLEEWRAGVQSIISDLVQGRGLGEAVSGSGDAVESGDEEDIDIHEEAVSSSQRRKKVTKQSRPDDLEDMKAPIPVDFTTVSTAQPKPMVPVNSPTHKNLTKQGYRIVGSHSGVKICRWTKSALRGRGSCYKHSFYGIASHLCMEATPSLSCSNKCVFCWRHGTNPVGTTWRWEVNEPEVIFQGMKEGHYRMVKAMRGVPGVRSERFAEAMKIRHCALSLVGEPIFYPHINRLLAMLHGEHISSFLVCNAQHPDHLERLGKVTQLYVSIDASNKDSLKRIDRPLHRDFWERFLRCMDILRAKRFQQRTVFRLTLVKGFNIEDEAEGYADLIERALPGFVEIKGVTYCGTSTSQGAGLSMQNVPFYEEVCAFVLALEAALARRGLSYGIGAEHAHSCCILLADKTRFFKPAADGIERWHTLIDYARFFECLESGKEFGPEDYIGEPTPEWALWGNGGFDPRDERVDRKGRPTGKVVEATATEAKS